MNNNQLYSIFWMFAFFTSATIRPYSWHWTTIVSGLFMLAALTNATREERNKTKKKKSKWTWN